MVSTRRRLPCLVLAAVLLLALLPFTSQPARASDETVCPPGLGFESGLCYVDDSDLNLGSRGSVLGLMSAEGSDRFPAVTMFRDRVACFGDGSDGRRVQVVWVKPDWEQMSTPKSRLYRAVGLVASIFEESARIHGGGPVKSPRFVHDSDCRPTILTVPAPRQVLDAGDYWSIVDLLVSFGLDRDDRKYLVFIDYHTFCGLATNWGDSRPSPEVNYSNTMVGYALNGASCWEVVSAHELAHTLGAVNSNAPNSSGAGHCLDDHDIMCYRDRSGQGTWLRCADPDWEYLLDCGGDDYFNPDPPDGSYLASHWNIYNSGFLGVVDSRDGSSAADVVGLYDREGRVRLVAPTMRGLEGVGQFYFGNPGDVLFAGDWDCDGTPTPGLYRQSDGFVYLRNSNTQGVADISFYFGRPGDVPIAGDFNGDGCDTVSIYRPSEARFYIINKLGKNGQGLGNAEYSFYFGNYGDVPFVGDFDGDGVDSFGLHRPSTGEVFLRNGLSAGAADLSFVFGNPGDLLTAGDWDGDGRDTVAVYRPQSGVLYLKNSNSAGWADAELYVGDVGGVAGFRR